MLAAFEWGWLTMERAACCALFAILTGCAGDGEVRSDACASATDDALQLEFEADLQVQQCASDCRLRMSDLTVAPDGSVWVIADVHYDSNPARDFLLLARYGIDGSLRASAKAASSSDATTAVSVDLASDAAGNALVAWQVRSNFTSTGDWDDELWIGRWGPDGRVLRAPTAYAPAARAVLQAGPDDSTILAGTVEVGGRGFVAKLDNQEREQWRFENFAEQVLGTGVSALVVDARGQSTVMAERADANGSSFHLWSVVGDGSLASERVLTSDHEVSSDASLLADSAGNLTAATYTRSVHRMETLIQRVDTNGEVRWSHTLIGLGGWGAPALTVDRTSGRVFVMTREQLDPSSYGPPTLSTLSSDGQRCDGYEYERPPNFDIVSIARGSGTDLYLLLGQGLVRYSGLRP